MKTRAVQITNQLHKDKRYPENSISEYLQQSGHPILPKRHYPHHTPNHYQYNYTIWCDTVNEISLK